MIWTLASRSLTGINVLHDRNPEYVLLSDGGVRNAYTIRILNKHNDARDFAISVDGLPGATLDVIGADAVDGTPVVDVGPDQTRELRAIVSLEGALPAPSDPVTFVVTDRPTARHDAATDNFRGPEPAR